MILSSSSKLLLLIAFIGLYKVEATPSHHPFLTKFESSEVNDIRIIGGQEITDKPVPFMVSVRRFTSHLCGGSILNERTILTAAHCFGESLPPPDYIKVHVGENTLTLIEGSIHNVTAIHIHPHYNLRNTDNDAAILRLIEPLLFNDRVKPIPVIEHNAKLKYGSIAEVYGWGWTFYGEKPPLSEILKVASVPLIEHGLCKHLMPGFKITANMLCAGVLAGGVDACRGDSGGPLLQNGKVIGIVSFGHKCALPNRAGIYTDVRRMLPWLKRTLARVYGERI